MNIVVNDVIEDFRNGVLFLILIGQLQGIFNQRAKELQTITDFNSRILCSFVRVFQKTRDRGSLQQFACPESSTRAKNIGAK